MQQWASANEHEVIGFATDLDVSGAVDPFDTPELGSWLQRPDEWDILGAWKLDRLARRAIPLNKLFGWCLDNDKQIVCVSDNIDLSTWVGRLVANVIAGVAEGELESIKERTKASHRKLRELGRWPGGRPAYGYRAQERGDAAGWELVPDEGTSVVLLGIIDRVLAGQSVESIAKTLDVPSPSGRGSWHSQTIRQLLRSKTLLGHVTHQGVTVRDNDGLPVHKGPALIDQERFDRLQAALSNRSFTTTKTGASPMQGVAVCIECEAPLYHRGQTTAGKLYRYYYCSVGKHGRQIPAEYVETLVEETFLDEHGNTEVRERVHVPGDSNETALREETAALDELTTLVGTLTSNTARERVQRQIAAVDARIAELEQAPRREARWEFRGTGRTYAEAWASADTEGRRELLVKAGITVAVLMRRVGDARPAGLPDAHIRVADSADL